MEESARIRYTNMLTARMRFARQANYEWSITTAEGELMDRRYEIAQAADEEVRAMIRQIAVAANFDSEIIDQITSAAWTRSKED